MRCSWLSHRAVPVSIGTTVVAVGLLLAACVLPDVMQLEVAWSQHQTHVEPDEVSTTPMDALASAAHPLLATMQLARQLVPRAPPMVRANTGNTTVDMSVSLDSFLSWNYFRLAWSVDLSETVVITPPDGEPMPISVAASLDGSAPMDAHCQVDFSGLLRQVLLKAGQNDTEVDDMFAEMQADSPDQWYELTHAKMLDECPKWHAAGALVVIALVVSALHILVDVRVAMRRCSFGLGAIGPALSVVTSLVAMAISISVRQTDKVVAGIEQQLAAETEGVPGLSIHLRLSAGFIVLVLGVAFSVASASLYLVAWRRRADTGRNERSLQTPEMAVLAQPLYRQF